MRKSRRQWEERARGNLFGVGGAQELAPLSNRLMPLKSYDSNRTTGHEGHEAVVKWLSLVLLVKLRGFFRRQRDDALPEDSES